MSERTEQAAVLAGSTEPEFGIREADGHWRPPYPARLAPLFSWPPKSLALLRWLFGWPGYLWPLYAFFWGLGALTWFFLQPPLEVTGTLRFGWIALMLLRNMVLVWIIAGGLQLVLYRLRLHGSRRKYHPSFGQPDSPRFWFGKQAVDNCLRSCLLGVPFWTAYEVLYVHGAARGWWPMLDIAAHPGWAVLILLLIPIWRELHFYCIHRLIHWKPLMMSVHRVHHMNPNPGPWTGLAMHPVELLLYFSVTAISFVVPTHPVHFFINSQLTALTPALGHHGFEGPLFKGRFYTGSYFHYLHHRFVACNYGEATIPLDTWFGSFYDGTSKFTPKKRYTGEKIE